RDDEIEKAQISIHVQREAMRRDPSCDVDSNCGNLAARRVHAGQTGNPERFNLKVTHRPNQDLFQVAHKAMNVFAIRTQVDDWVADKLAKAVISNLTAAIRFKDSHATRSQKFFRHDDSVWARSPAERERVRMFEQKQRVRLLARQNRAFSSFLHIERGAVFDASQALDF